MSPSDYQAYLEKTKSRKKKLDKYADVILTLLNTHHDYNTSQIHDKLKERFPNESDAIVYSTLDVMLLNYLKKGKMNFIYRNYDEPINLDT
jgi:Fe2+ or Zn2+ uptake regulation protein